MGDKPALANVMNFSAGILFEVAHGAFIEAAAYAAAEGSKPEDFVLLLPETLRIISDSIEQSATQLASGDYAGDEASIEVHASAVGDIAKRMGEIGTASHLTAALLEYFHAAKETGSGALEFAAIYDVIRHPGEK